MSSNLLKVNAANLKTFFLDVFVLHLWKLPLYLRVVQLLQKVKEFLPFVFGADGSNTLGPVVTFCTLYHTFAGQDFKQYPDNNCYTCHFCILCHTFACNPRLHKC